MFLKHYSGASGLLVNNVIRIYKAEGILTYIKVVLKLCSCASGLLINNVNIFKEQKIMFDREVVLKPRSRASELIINNVVRIFKAKEILNL